ncbi:MAG: helix-turn-helix transcriptional regulator [Bacteroidota bacterium]
MKDQAVSVKFQNRQNPRSGFDLIKLESVMLRRDLEHPAEQLHTVEFFMLVFVEAGSGYHTIDFTDYACEPGTILSIRKGQLQKFVPGGTYKGMLLLFTDDFLSKYLEKPEAQKTIQLFNELLGNPKIQLDAPEMMEISMLIDHIKKEYFTLNDDFSQGIIRSQLHILISKLYRIKATKNQVISERKYLTEFIELQRLVEERVTEQPRVSDYARMLGKSTKTLNNITQSIIHKTAKEFIDTILVQQIKRLLINTDHPIKEVADLTGFLEVTNFYKYFKRHTGFTPERFRRAQY